MTLKRGWRGGESARRLLGWCVMASAAILFLPVARAGNFYAGTSPANVPWTNGIVPYEFTNSLTAAQKQTYLDGLREWELAANVKFVPHTNQSRYILFAYNTNGINNVSTGYTPQVVTVSSLSRAQVGHEMGHSFGFNHENIRPDQTNFLVVLSNNVSPGNLGLFQADPTTVTNGNYDFESVMHLGWDFASTSPGVLATQQPKPPYFPRYQFRMGNLALSPGDRAALRFLYGPPAVPLTNIVTTTADAGPGSLRAAMYYVTDNPGAIVRFSLPTNDPGYSNGVFTIRLTGHLPPLVTNGMVIDGSTQPGFTGRPLIVVDGSQIILETFTSNSGLLIYSANNQVKSLSFHGFNWNGLTLNYADATNNTIGGCWIGLDATGSNAAPNTKQGILFGSGASWNLIGGSNVISGNLEYAIWMSDTNTVGNRIAGNYIGTDPSGSFAISNGLGGIGIFTNGTGHVIGGTNAASRNVISGNISAGIWLSGAGVSNNVVQGNYIGLNAAGTAAVSNTFAGVYLINGASSNAILNNVISGNFMEGLRVSASNTRGNLIQGNFFGTDAVGTNAVPNGFAGVTVLSAVSNQIGGTSVVARNIISGNGTVGLDISGTGTVGNIAQGNFIGTDVSGTVALPNGFAGVYLLANAQNNLIGGTTPGAGNLISGNATVGIDLAGGVSNVVQGNFVGTDWTGSNAVPNGLAGFYIVSGARNNLIGGAPSAGNVVSGNGSYGFLIGDPTTSSNLIQGNLIGTRANGSNALGNGFVGILLASGSHDHVIGLALDGSGAGNRIAFNLSDGIRLDDAATIGNTIRGNTIYSNSGLGIDLAAPSFFGPTLNDTGDGDLGPNNLQNFPVFTAASVSGNVTLLSGTFNGATNRSFILDFYRNTSADSSGYGEGEFYAGSTTITTDGNGNGIFGFGVSGSFIGNFFTVTATDTTTGDTSEFNQARIAQTGGGPPTLTGPFTANSNGFSFRLSGQVNQYYRIQATTNLGARPILWVDLTNFIASPPVIQITDRTATNLPLRFYRAVSP